MQSGNKTKRLTIMQNYGIKAFGIIGTIIFAAGCTPTVKIEVPDKPIEINLNINMKIEQNVFVKLQENQEKTIKSRPDLF